MNKLVALCSVVLVVAVSCAGADVRPLVDMKGVNEAAYEKDLSDCQAYAQQQSGMGETAAKGAGAGAVVGGLLGLVTGGNKTGIAQAAGLAAGDLLASVMVKGSLAHAGIGFLAVFLKTLKRASPFIGMILSNITDTFEVTSTLGS